MLGFYPIGTYPLADIETVSGVTLDVPAAAVSIAAAAPSVQTGVSVAVPAASISLAGFAPAIETGASIVSPAADLAVAAFAPGISTGVSVSAPAAGMAFAAFAPSILFGVTIKPPAADISVLALAPAVAAGASASVPSGNVTVLAFAPSVAAGASVTVPALGVSIFCPAPRVIVPTIGAPAANINVSGASPTILTGVNATVPAAGVTVAAFAPGIGAGQVEVVVPGLTITVGAQIPVIIAAGLSYPLSLPDGIRIAQVSFQGESAVTRSESPFTFKQQVVRFPGQRWSVDISVPPFRRETMEPLVAFLLAMNGPEKTFLLGDPKNKTPRGSARGLAQVKGGGQTGNSLLVDGATAGTVGWLKAGDWIQLGTGASSRLYKVLQDVTSDGDGNARIFIWPDLRSSPADNAAVRLENTVGVFRLANNNTAWSINEVCTYGISFSAVEAV